MPISQSRMISLIQAARAFERALAQARREILQRAEIIRLGRGNPAAELQELVSIIRPEFMVPGYAEHLANLAIEERHFATHQRYNVQRAQRQEAKRRANGTPQQTSAPPSLRPSLHSVPATAPARLTAQTLQPPSLYDEASASGEGEEPSDGPLNISVAPPRLLKGTLTPEQRAQLEAEAAEWNASGAGGEEEPSQ